MYKPTFDKYIDFQDEKNAIVEFCNKHWTVKENKDEFNSLVNFLFDFGSTLGANRFNASEVNQVMQEVIKKEMATIKKARENKNLSDGAFDNYDKKSRVYYLISDLDRFLNNDEELNYDKYMPKLLKEVKSNFSSIKTIKPVNWKKYLANPDQFENEGKEKFEDFKGSKSSVGVYIWMNFADTNTLSSIEYNNERGRKPLEALVGAIVNQAYASQIHNNTVDMINELNSIISNKKIDNLDLLQISSTIESKPLKVLFEAASFDDEKQINEEEFKENIFSRLKYSSSVTKKNKI